MLQLHLSYDAVSKYNTTTQELDLMVPNFYYYYYDYYYYFNFFSFFCSIRVTRLQVVVELIQFTLT